MFEKIANIFRIPDLRKRVLFTLGILAVYRLGSRYQPLESTSSYWPNSSTSRRAARSAWSTCSAAETFAA